MKLTNRKTTSLYKFLTGLEKEANERGELVKVNRNKITDKVVRAAIIDNIVALAHINDEVKKQESILQEQYFTDEYIELYKQFIAAGKMNDTAKLEMLNEAMKEAEKPFASEYLASREKLLNEEKEINLTLIDRDAFDAATEACDFSMKVYVEFAFMFETNKGGKNEEN